MAYYFKEMKVESTVKNNVKTAKGNWYSEVRSLYWLGISITLVGNKIKFLNQHKTLLGSKLIFRVCFSEV